MQGFHGLTTSSRILQGEFSQQRVLLISHQGGLDEIAVDESQLRLVNLGRFAKGAVEIAKRPIHVAREEDDVFSCTQLSGRHGVGVGSHVGFHGPLEHVASPTTREIHDAFVMRVGTLVIASGTTLFHDAKILGHRHVETEHGRGMVATRGVDLDVLMQRIQRHHHHLVVVTLHPMICGSGLLHQLLTLKWFAVIDDARPKFGSRHAV